MLIPLAVALTLTAAQLPYNTRAPLQTVRALRPLPALTDLRELGRSEASGVTRVKLQQLHAGLPVLDGRMTLTLDASGQARISHDALANKLGALPPVAVSPYAAAVKAFHSVGHVDINRLSTASLNVTPKQWVMNDNGTTRVVYEVPVVGVNPFERKVAFVDATTGKLVRVRDLTVSATHTVKAFDAATRTRPGVKSVQVTTTTDTAMRGTKIDTRNCLHATAEELDFYVVPLADVPELAQFQDYAQFVFGRPIDWVVVPLCAEEAKALPTVQYDPPADLTSSNDAFAEVNFYYHADRIARWFSGNTPDSLAVGFTGRANEPLRGTVNFKTPSQDTLLCTTAAFEAPAAGATPEQIQAAALAAFKARGDATVNFIGNCGQFKTFEGPVETDFAAFDNAFFMPALDPQVGGFISQFRPFDSMVFGQGAIDFAYDGSVVYHEYTHAIVNTVDALQDGMTRDEWGMDAAPGAMNEGLSDYFAMVLTDNGGCVGELSSVLAGPGAECLRDLREVKTCPEDLFGEVHYDAEPFAGALWAARNALPASDRAEFDRAVFVTLDDMPNDAQFSTFNDRLLVEVTDRGLDVALVKAELEKRNVLACERVVTLEEGDESKPIFIMAASEDIGEFAPGFVQYKLDVPPLTEKIEISFSEIEQNTGGGAVSIPGLPGQAEEALDVRVFLSTKGPIKFSYPTEGTPDDAEELTKKSKKFVFTADAITDGPWYIALGSFNSNQRIIEKVSFSVTAEFDEPKKEEPKKDEPKKDEPKNDVLNDTPQPKSGCAATGGPADGFTGLLAAFSLVAYLIGAARARNRRIG